MACLVWSLLVRFKGGRWIVGQKTMFFFSSEMWVLLLRCGTLSFFSRKKIEFIIWCNERNVVKIGLVVQREKEYWFMN